MQRRITVTKLNQIKNALSIAQRGDVIVFDEIEHGTDDIIIEEIKEGGIGIGGKRARGKSLGLFAED